MGKLETMLRKMYPFASEVNGSKDAKLYHNTAFGTREDPHFLMTSKEGHIINFGRTALIKSISKVGDDGLHDLVYRDEQGNFPGLDEDKHKLIDWAYDLVHTMNLDKDEYSRIFKGLNANSVISRFKDFNLMKSERDIIPDYNDFMVFLKVSDGCVNKCMHCPEGGRIELYSKEKILDNMDFLRQIQEKYHGSESRKFMYEGFLNTSDILWFEKLKSDIRPAEIVWHMTKKFPELSRIGTFFELQNVLDVCATGNPDKPYDASYLEELASLGLTRAYVGVETAHYHGSNLLGKSESYETKKQGIELLKDAKIGVKAIVLMGALGQGFYDNHGRFHSSGDAVEETAKLLHETKPYRVMYSKFLPLENLPIMEHYGSGKIVPYDTGNGAEQEMNSLTKKLYERRLVGPRRWQGEDDEPVIEDSYHDFVENRKRLAG